MEIHINDSGMDISLQLTNKPSVYQKKSGRKIKWRFEL